VNRQEMNKRRALIVRRQAAYRASQTQREIWRKRREELQIDDLDEGVGVRDDLAELPDVLLG